MGVFSKFLTAFTGPRVRMAGFLIAFASAFLLHGLATVGYLVALGVAILSTYYPKAFNWLSNFADPQFWPAFVGLGVAILFAAHAGGLFGLLACAGPLTAYDGMYFDQNY